MKGLLIKDFKLIKNQSWFILVIFFISIACSAIAESPFFSLGYATSLITVFAINSVGFDEYDNGMAYVFALPISRKVYVKEKYVFGIIVAFAAMGFALLISLGIAFAKRMVYPVNDWIEIMTLSLSLIMMMLALILPVRLKYAADKNKFVLFIAVGVIVLSAYAVFGIAELMGIDLEKLIEEVFLANMLAVLGGAIVIGMVLLAVSYKIAVRIMEKREF